MPAYSHLQQMKSSFFKFNTSKHCKKRLPLKLIIKLVANSSLFLIKICPAQFDLMEMNRKGVPVMQIIGTVRSFECENGCFSKIYHKILEVVSNNEENKKGK